MPNKKKGGATTSPAPWLIPISAFRNNATPVLPPAMPAMPTQPNLPSMPLVQPGGSIDVLSATIQTLNSNPYLIGILMLLLNLGGRFLSLELTKKQEEFLQQRWLRPLLFFTVIFIATRNLAVAFWVTLLFFFVIWVLANEKSPFCLIPSWKEGGDANNQKSSIYEQNITQLSNSGIKTPV
jgi:hypothetical protein